MFLARIPQIPHIQTSGSALLAGLHLANQDTKPGLNQALKDWTGLDWTGLDWIGLDWIGLDWNRLDWLGLDWGGLNWIGLD